MFLGKPRNIQAENSELTKGVSQGIVRLKSLGDDSKNAVQALYVEA